MPAPDPIEEAIAEARRRLALGERDASSAVEHFAATLRPVCEEWGLAPERWLGGGASTPTLAVTSAGGTAGVLKLEEPGALDAAAAVMRAADGRGYARVLAWSPERGALLTERLGEDLWRSTPRVADQARVIVPLLVEAWRVPWECGTPYVGKAAGLLGILDRLGPRYGTAHPAALDQARRYAAELAASERPEVVCHGDPHAGNVLRRRDGWALIDPDGFVGERAYDLGVVVRDACREVFSAEARRTRSGAELLRSGCEEAARLGAADAERVWRWAFVERVTTGLYLRWFGFPDESDSFLGSAVLLAG